jgi:undecaprenyl diphosphate synthase
MVDLHSLADEGTEEMQILQSLDLSRLPRHVAIIMDGNGRWAGRRHLPRVAGHRAGIASVRDVVEASARLGLEAITLYAFSKENWKRPRAEVDTLMQLLREYLRRELETLQKNRIRFRVIGAIEELATSVREELERGMTATAGNDGLLFNIALSYGGRAEIVEACRRLLTEAAAGRIDPASVDEATFARFLYTAGVPDPDLLIRTSGEMRVSNFLLWQIAYAEIWVTETLWPDFRRRELFRAIADFQKRNRRYGGIGSEEGGRSGPSKSGLKGALARS